MSQTQDYYRSPALPDRPRGAKAMGMMIAGPFIWFFPALIATAVVGGVVGFLFFPPMVVISPFVVFFAAFAINRFLRIRAQQRAVILIGYVENAVRLNLPIYAFLTAAEASERGAIRRRLQCLRQMLAAGSPLGASLLRAELEFPRQITAEIDVAEQSGRLGPALTRIVKEQADRAVGAPDDLAPFYRLYPLGLAICTTWVMLGYAIYVVPKFEEIFKDFKAVLPAQTQFILNIGDFLTDDIGWMSVGFLILMGAALIVAIAFFMQRIFTPFWPFPRFGYLRDFLSWHIPFWRQMQRSSGLAAVNQVLADATQAGAPLTDALVRARSLEMNRFLRKELDAWYERMLAGEPPGKAAAAAGLPPVFTGFLASAETSRASSEQSSLASILAFLARYYRDRFSRAIVLLRAVSEPLMVLMLGLIVGFLVIALFLPLVKLIGSVAGYDGGIL